MTGIDRKMKVISSSLGFHHRGRGGHRGASCSCRYRNEWEFFVYYKVEKHKNICHLQPNACNALVDKQL